MSTGDALEIHIDADYSIGRDGAQAIEMGVRAALRQAGDRIGGLPVSVVPKDHRANTKRSGAHLRAFAANPNALAVFGGVQSPPYLALRDEINEKGILLMLPWSAAGPITRAQPGATNWIFRLSVDDTKAGPFLVRRAVNHGGCLQTSLVLLDTGWGRANRDAMTRTFADMGLGQPLVVMFSARIGEASALTLASQVAAVGTDCVILLATAKSGAVLTNALYEAAPAVRVFSHWGILAGDFTGAVSHSVREALHMEVLQTCGLHIEARGSAVLDAALGSAQALGSDHASLSEMPAATGFVHGYDLATVLIAAAAQAAEQSGWHDGTIAQRRSMIRAALENLNAPVPGILKTYSRPFRPYATDDPDAHEALGLQDLCVAYFSDTGRLMLATPGRH